MTPVETTAALLPPDTFGSERPSTPVCRWDDLVPDRGVCALVDGVAVAIFRCSFGSGLYALDNLDPYSGASVLSRGLVGVTTDGVAFVSSPLRKQRFDLSTGRSLDDAAIGVRCWPASVVDGVVTVATGSVASVSLQGITDGQ